MSSSDRELRLHQIQQFEFDRVWPLAARWLSPALEHGDGAYTLDQLRMMVSLDRAYLLALSRGEEIVGALVVTIVRRPQYTVASVMACGGRFIVKEGWQQFTQWAAAWGCSRIETWANASRLRLYESVGFKPVATVIQFDLGEHNAQ